MKFFYSRSFGFVWFAHRFVCNQFQVQTKIRSEAVEVAIKVHISCYNFWEKKGVKENSWLRGFKNGEYPNLKDRVYKP